MSDRLLSGHDSLDAVLGGGLPANAISLFMGLPGTGKTILAQQYVFKNSRPEHPAVYFSTVSEPLEKIVRFAQSLDFFDPAAIGTSVLYEDLGATLSSEGLAAVGRRVMAVLRERHPGLVVIDSFKALHAFADGYGDFRQFLHELAGRLTAYPAASLWLGEYEDAEIGSLPEFAVADAIVELLTERYGQREFRFLQVRKLRGSGFRSGRHAYRLSSAGIHVFPRLADVADATEYELGGVRMSSGIPALDELLADGYWPGASTLVAGPSGSGKTLMGLHFIFNGARQGQHGVIAALQENTTQLRRIAAGFGWSLSEPGVEVMYRSPVDIYIDEWADDLLRAVERTGATRVLIDSLADLRLAAPDEIRFREFIYSLVQRFSRQGVSCILTFEIHDLFGTGRLTDGAISHLSDNVVLLRYFQHRATIGRTISVIKTRASRHTPVTCAFDIGPEGITLGGPLSLAGEPVARGAEPEPVAPP
ncbi:MAG TPA: ATPase domain-containing protein [Streptosporangiaceae bacterium]|nr:ATPase domain-containing protein [Streptosporangiaceae bacterium]